MTAVFVGTGCACAVVGVIVTSLMIGILAGVCRLKKFKARKKRHVCVHANVIYYMCRCMYELEVFSVCFCVCASV